MGILEALVTIASIVRVVAAVVTVVRFYKSCRLQHTKRNMCESGEKDKCTGGKMSIQISIEVQK